MDETTEAYENYEAPFQDEVVPAPEVDGHGHDHEHTDEESTSNIVVPTHIVETIRLAPSGVEILSTAVDLAYFLAQKNIAYGDSALNPVRVFSKADPKEQILVRMDDKINRLMKGTEFIGDDDLKDLLGYLLLYFVAVSRHG
jgi:hypothetical protein